MAKQRQKQLKNKLKNLQRVPKSVSNVWLSRNRKKVSALAQNLALLSDDEPKSSALETALDVESTNRASSGFIGNATTPDCRYKVDGLAE